MSEPRHDRSFDAEDVIGGAIDADENVGEGSRRRRFLRLLNRGWLLATLSPLTV